MVRSHTYLLTGTKEEKAKVKKRENASNKARATNRSTKITNYLASHSISQKEFAEEAGIPNHVMADFMRGATQTGSMAYDRSELYMKFNK